MKTLKITGGCRAGNILNFKWVSVDVFVGNGRNMYGTLCTMGIILILMLQFRAERQAISFASVIRKNAEQGYRRVP